MYNTSNAGPLYFVAFFLCWNCVHTPCSVHTAADTAESQGHRVKRRVQKGNELEMVHRGSRMIGVTHRMHTEGYGCRAAV